MKEEKKLHPLLAALMRTPKRRDYKRGDTKPSGIKRAWSKSWAANKSHRR